MWPVWVSFAGSVPCAQHVGSNWKRHLSVREEGRGVARGRRAVAPEGGRAGVRARQSGVNSFPLHTRSCVTRTRRSSTQTTGSQWDFGLFSAIEVLRFSREMPFRNS